MEIFERTLQDGLRRVLDLVGTKDTRQVTANAGQVLREVHIRDRFRLSLVRLGRRHLMAVIPLLDSPQPPSYPGRAMSLDLNVTIVIVLALFLVPLLFLNILVFRPFLKLFDERHERLEGSVKRAEEMLERAEEQARTFSERIKVATAKGLEVRNEMRTKAQKEMNAKLEAERGKLAEKLAGALKELEGKRSKALSDIQGEAHKIAEATASKLLGRAL
ncbi:MAG: ATP synthase F0 subunit B [Myxococcota bacterium]